MYLHNYPILSLVQLSSILCILFAMVVTWTPEVYVSHLGSTEVLVFEG